MSSEPGDQDKEPPDIFKCCEHFDKFADEGSSLIDHLEGHLLSIKSSFDNDLSQAIQRGEFRSLPRLCPGCQKSDLFGNLEYHPLFQTYVSSWTPDIEEFQEHLVTAVNRHIDSCSYLKRMGELIGDMKKSTGCVR